MDGTDNALEAIERQLQQFPQATLEEYRHAHQLLSRRLTPPDLQAWAESGALISSQTARSWEAAVEYFRASPALLAILPWGSLSSWAQCGEILCQDSPTLATAYFRASPAAVAHLHPRQVEAWGHLGQRLYKGTWKSSALAARFFEVSPALLRHIPFSQLERFASFTDALAHRSYDMAAECLFLSQEVFPLFGENLESFLNLLSSVLDNGWRDVKGCLEAGGKAVLCIEQSQRAHFLQMTERLARGGHTSLPSFMLQTSQALRQVDSSYHATLLNLAEMAQVLCAEAMPEFLKSCPTVLSRTSLERLELWFAEGNRLLRDNREGGLSYFRMESARSVEVLETLSSGVELARNREVLRMYCQALAGSAMEIATTQELVQKGIGWVSNERPTTEGNKIFLPPLVDRYPKKDSNFAWYKVVATHQVAHLEFGSFTFAFEKASNLFQDLRPHLSQGSKAQALPGSNGSDAEQGWLTDMQRFFNTFEDRKLALDIFTVVEDARLDHRVQREYAGIRPAYHLVQGNALEERPRLETLPAREALVELLVRFSLQPQGALPVPQHYAREAKRILRILKRVMDPRAWVEDSAEATLRIYAILSQLPNEELPTEEWESLEPPPEGEEETEDLEELLDQLSKALDLHEGQEEQGKPYTSPKEVDFRGDFKPELVQLLAKLKQTQQQKSTPREAPGISKEALEQHLAQSAELEVVQGDITTTAGMFANNLLQEAGAIPPLPDQGLLPLVHVEEEGGPLQTSEPDTYLYDEWDFRADDYKPRWCMVREKPMNEGDPAFYLQTLGSYAALVTQVRRQFERMIPETFRKIKRLPDGEEFDLDAVIEAMVDKRTGVSPSDKLYWRRNKVDRDVAVVFLLDMSASTAEAIDEAKRLADDWDAPNDPVEYMMWLRSRRSEGARRSYKRIIDLEKESTVILIQALETLGDQYGIYGFSGYGRENVEFYIIKDLNESFTEQVKRRIDKVSPLHATRMGPAIRHATFKLDAVDAKTKVLFLISDGRPQDRGYSREGVEKEYAVHDTKVALTEARRKDIIPFCLTVDRAGHDYLKAMCTDMGYEVLADIHALPQRLLELYRGLTV